MQTQLEHLQAREGLLQKRTNSFRSSSTVRTWSVRFRGIAWFAIRYDYLLTSPATVVSANRGV